VIALLSQNVPVGVQVVIIGGAIIALLRNLARSLL